MPRTPQRFGSGPSLWHAHLEAGGRRERVRAGYHPEVARLGVESFLSPEVHEWV